MGITTMMKTVASTQPPIMDMVLHLDAPLTLHAQTQSHSTTIKDTMVFLNTFNGSQYQLLTLHRALLCQNTTPRITHGTLHHHGTPKKITAQLKVVVQCQISKTIHHEK